MIWVIKQNLNKIKLEDYFNSEIQKRKAISKTLGKYITVFDYIDKALIVLSATSRGISVTSFVSLIEVSIFLLLWQ